MPGWAEAAAEQAEGEVRRSVREQLPVMAAASNIALVAMFFAASSVQFWRDGRRVEAIAYPSLWLVFTAVGTWFFLRLRRRRRDRQ